MNRNLGQQFEGTNGTPDPVPVALEGRQRWSSMTGRSALPLHVLQGAVMHPSVVQRIGSAYNDLPEHDPDATPAFQQMAKETHEQFDFMTRPRHRGGLGIDVDFVQHDPYSGAAEMHHDLRENNRIQVYKTGTDESGHHPFFPNETNDMFRAVHDVFGHAGIGSAFHRHGEEGAFLSHAQMFSPLARQAMATETRGQNTWFISYGGGEHFPVQKTAILPRWARTPLPILGRRGERAASNLQAQQFNVEHFGGKP